MERDPVKARAWQQRSGPLVVDPARYDSARRARGSTLRQRSAAFDAYYAAVRRPAVAALLSPEARCAAPGLFAGAGVVDPVARCGGVLDVHERRRRGQGGSLERPANLVVLCRVHHDGATAAGRGSAYHRAGLVAVEGDAGWAALGAARGERKQRPW